MSLKTRIRELRARDDLVRKIWPGRLGYAGRP